MIMDENMPRLNGTVTTSYIRERERQAGVMHIPVVALTANALKGDRERFLEAGMDEYLTKPVSRESLYEVVRQQLGKTIAGEMIDIDVIAGVLELDREDVILLARLFKEGTENALSEVREGIATGNSEMIYRAFHKIAGSTATILGLPGIVQIAAEAERLAKEGARADYRQYHDRIASMIAGMPLPS